MTRGRGRAGWGLIEVLVAMALAFALITGAAEMMTLALRAKRRGDVIAALTCAVAERLESLKALPFDDPGLAPGTYQATVLTEPGRTLVAESWVIDGDGDPLRRIRLRAWESGRPGASSAALLFVSRDLGFAP